MAVSTVAPPVAAIITIPSISPVWIWPVIAAVIRGAIIPVTIWHCIVIATIVVIWIAIDRITICRIDIRYRQGDTDPETEAYAPVGQGCAGSHEDERQRDK